MVRVSRLSVPAVLPRRLAATGGSLGETVLFGAILLLLGAFIAYPLVRVLAVVFGSLIALPLAALIARCDLTNGLRLMVERSGPRDGGSVFCLVRPETVRLLATGEGACWRRRTSSSSASERYLIA
jgi:hypothetical protein